MRLFIEQLPRVLPSLVGGGDFVKVVLTDFYTDAFISTEQMNRIYLENGDFLNHFNRHYTLRYRSVAKVTLSSPNLLPNEVLPGYSIDLSEIPEPTSQKVSIESGLKIEAESQNWSFFCCKK